MEHFRKQILIVQPVPVVRLGLVHMIVLGSEMKVCADSATLARARSLLPRHQPDIVIVDPAMEDGEGFVFLKEASAPPGKTIVFSRSLNAATAQRAFQCGARAIISHQDSQESVLAALTAVMEGRRHIAPCASDAIAGGLDFPENQGKHRAERLLSERELQIYHLLGRGCAVKEMAAQLGISSKTVESNQTRMKEKLGLKSNAALRHEATLFVSRQDGQSDAPNTAGSSPDH